MRIGLQTNPNPTVPADTSVSPDPSCEPTGQAPARSADLLDDEPAFGPFANPPSSPARPPDQLVGESIAHCFLRTHRSSPARPSDQLVGESTAPAFCEPLVKPLFHPGQAPAPSPDSGKNAKNAAPPLRFAGPAPTSTTGNPDAFGQYPAGSRSEDDPCLGLRRLRTGGAFGSFIIPHRCDKVNTLVGGSIGFFCHSAVLSDEPPACSRLPAVFGFGVRCGSPPG